ncbi:uncharacterized protein SETTUDRAFT_32134 [Exserohilum turcica Et28A]|uniref:Uncharacterized protein n=1 Tax=Exserohilum turcicum (strain 28A) TaxID=671987 RepID=R0K5V6_EXST2|nr:uncharacterized protein SETTUDRAFT_32134 [Exserohilum turcica Et28A]EOA84894.1 hypothetical protein SETTUDRAFT_32134 [Exserohilum turcica Et28A]
MHDKLEAITNLLTVQFITLVLLLITAFLLFARFGLVAGNPKPWLSQDTNRQQPVEDVGEKDLSKEAETPIAHDVVSTTPGTLIATTSLRNAIAFGYPAAIRVHLQALSRNW